jgi:regulatory protein
VAGGERTAESEALRLLARRPLSVAELRRRLASRGHDPRAVEWAVERLARAGYLDDLALAVEFILVRAARRGYGRERLLAELARRGVDPRTAAEAWTRALGEEPELDRASLRRRVCAELARAGGRLDARAYRRVYNALLRAGFDGASVESELAPYRDFPEP